MNKHWITQTGIGLVLLSVAVWTLLLAVPWIPFSIAVKTWIGGAVLILAEVLFWGGAALAGPELVQEWKARIASGLQADPQAVKISREESPVS